MQQQIIQKKKITQPNKLKSGLNIYSIKQVDKVKSKLAIN